MCNKTTESVDMDVKAMRFSKQIEYEDKYQHFREVLLKMNGDKIGAMDPDGALAYKDASIIRAT